MGAKRLYMNMLIILLKITILWILLEPGIQISGSVLHKTILSSLPRNILSDRLDINWVQDTVGPSWNQLGRIADPESEPFVIEIRKGRLWNENGTYMHGLNFVHC